jgi:mRNA-degrading endonuclease RelE of RelBE toxin-antitoxin system
MTYKVEFTRHVIKIDLKKLSKKQKDSFMRAIRERIAVRPYDFKPLSGKKYRDMYRLRVGDHRIVYHVNEDMRLATIWCIDIRGKVYDLLENRL